jgi:hypothetical protein
MATPSPSGHTVGEPRGNLRRVPLASRSAGGRILEIRCRGAQDSAGVQLVPREVCCAIARVDSHRGSRRSAGLFAHPQLADLASGAARHSSLAAEPAIADVIPRVADLSEARSKDDWSCSPTGDRPLVWCA